MEPLAAADSTHGRCGMTCQSSCVLNPACCPSRFHSLASYGGDDDLFSSDFSNEQLKERLSHMAAWPTLVGRPHRGLEQLNGAFRS